jgi:hypothetical protein
MSEGGKCLFLGILYAVLRYHNKEPGAAMGHIPTDNRPLTAYDLISAISIFDSSIYVALILVSYIVGYPFANYVKVAVVTIFRQFPSLSSRHNIAIW